MVDVGVESEQTFAIVGVERKVINFCNCGCGEESDNFLQLWVWREGCTEDEGQGGEHHRVSHQL